MEFQKLSNCSFPEYLEMRNNSIVFGTPCIYYRVRQLGALRPSARRATTCPAGTATTHSSSTLIRQFEYVFCVCVCVCARVCLNNGHAGAGP